MWLGEQLGIDAAVLPATIEPVRREIELVPRSGAGQGPDGPGRVFKMLRLVDDPIRAPEPAVAAIDQAKWTLLAPGDLYRSVLSTAAVPDIAAALARTSGRVVWIANLEPDRDEPASSSVMEHLEVLRLHGVRVDAVLHDPSAALKVDPAELERHGVESIARPLTSARRRAVHSRERLRSALTALLEPARGGPPRADQDTERSGVSQRR